MNDHRTSKREPRGIGAVEVGGRVLRVLAQSSSPMMLRDLAERAQLTPAQAHGYLSSFRRADLVEQDAETGRYTLGSATLRLGLRRLQSNGLLVRATEAARTLSSATGMMVALTVWGPAAPTVVHVTEDIANLGIHIRPGSMFSVCGSAIGVVFAAFADEQTISNRIAAEKQGATMCGLDPNSLEAPTPSQLASARQRRHWGRRDDPVAGLSCVGSPAFGMDGRLELVVGLLCRNAEINFDQDHPALFALLAVTAQLSVGDK